MPPPPPIIFFFFQAQTLIRRRDGLFWSCQILTMKSSHGWATRRTAQAPWRCVLRRKRDRAEFFPRRRDILRTTQGSAEGFRLTSRFTWALDPPRTPPRTPPPHLLFLRPFCCHHSCSRAQPLPTFRASADAKGSDAYQCCAPVSLRGVFSFEEKKTKKQQTLNDKILS